MKRVLIIATLHTFINKFEKSNIELLKNMGYEVHTIASNYNMVDNPDTEVINNNISITRNPLSISNLKAYFFIKRYINNNEIDLVHCHTPVGGVLGRLCNKKRRKMGISKTVYTAHGFHFYKGAPFVNWLLYFTIEKWLSKYTDILITINKEDYQLAKKFKARKLEYIPGVGIDTHSFQLRNFDREKYREKIGLKESQFMILSVGELNKNKNHELIIKTLKEINNPNIVFCIAGDGVLKNYLIDLSNKLEISKQIHLFGFRKDIAELYYCADLYILPSIREGLNVSLMEAMACGIPCLASNIRGNVDLIKPNENGFLFNNKNIKNLVCLIEKIYTSKTLLSKLSCGSRKYIKPFDKEYVMKEMNRIYLTIE